MHWTPRPWAALAAAGALTLTGWAAVAPAHAAPAATAATAATGPTRAVTVVLTPPDRAALYALAAQPITDRAQRLSALKALVPSATQRGTVASVLRSEGFTVTRQSTWTVSATAPQSLVTSVFGARPTAAAAGVTAAAAATGPLGRMPVALSGLASVAYPTTGGPAPFHHAAARTLDGQDFRNADTPAGVTPSTGGNDNGLTVATLQLAQYDKSDLSNYAQEHGLADPVANGNYQEETVDGGPTDTNGDIEVDLDQESILSTAPSAHQLAYFAPNTDAGFDDVFSNLYDDVTDSSRSTYDPHISAISVSWGACEASYGKTSIEALEPILASVVGAGVNIFSSSGDDGIYDCRSTSGTGLDNMQEDVDFPTSSPFSISVGGTNLQSSGSSAPYDGSNWTETAWSCTSSVSCESQAGTGGTGGGVSGAAYNTTNPVTSGDFEGFAKPAYQSTYVTTAPFAAPTKRMVPDIAADGDPNTGFELYTSDPEYTALCQGNDCQVGGTSLAAPISAAQFTNTLGDAGITTGVGDIHTALYRAASQTAGLASTNPAKVFRDVTVGTNGSASDAHVDPSVSAAPGYDTTTGLGGVLWSALTPYLPTPASGPKVTATIRQRGTAHDTAVPAIAQWKVKKGSTPLARESITLTRDSTTVFSAAKAAGSHRFLATRGATYTLTVTGVDTAGRSTTKTATFTAPSS